MSTVFNCPHCGTPHSIPSEGMPDGGVCVNCGQLLQGVAVAPGTPPRTARPTESDYADDRWERAERVQREPRLPGTVRAAGIIWVVFGALILLSGGLQILSQLVLAPPQARGSAIAGSLCSAIFVAFVGGVFVHVGIQSLGGMAKDTLGNGIGSIIFAAIIGGLTLVALVAIVAVQASRPQATGPVWAVLLALIINGLGAVALLAAGILALVGRQGYRAYRSYHYPIASRRQRRR